jgi:hypothetical protein
MPDMPIAAQQLAPPEIRRAREQLLLEMYDASDRWEAERYPEFIAADVAFRFGNAEPARGRDAIQATMRQMQGIVRLIRHEVRDLVHGLGDHVTAAIDMHYERNDGAILEVPALVLFHFNGEGLVDEYRISMDAGDFFSGAR